jgi:hypothetical protein
MVVKIDRSFGKEMVFVIIASKPQMIYANDFINLTERTFSVYDYSTGDIWDFPPTTIVRLNQGSLGNAGDFIVVDDKSVKEISEDDLVRTCRIMEESSGRNGIQIARIISSFYPDVQVRIRNYGDRHGILRIE